MESDALPAVPPPSHGSAIFRAFGLIAKKEREIAEIRDAIRENLMERRKAQGLTQKDMAEKLGFRSAAYVSELESGSRKWTEGSAKLADSILPNAEVSDAKHSDH